MDNENVATTAATETATGNTLDYKAEYEKAIAEVEKQKKQKDAYAKENAEYKRKAQEQMTEEERKTAEYNQLVESNTQMQKELNEYKLERELLANGFTAEESKKLKDSGISITAIKSLAEIISSRLEENTKSVRAEGIKSTTSGVPLGRGTTGEEGGKTNFQLYQDSLKKDTKYVALKK